ncbi:protein trichome birefringence-like 2 [Papaver somniferum]|uniref:protein trichome birefringence-like 2 n=1 Tax=Papaver somniferum TaxID=3469 RepID=UPI000E6F6B2A|nr:protein trichome birefringence-like 2 [Papaver somniferum]
MERHGTWAKLCHLMETVRSTRKDSMLLVGFGFIFGASTFIFIASIFILPFLSPSRMNPLLQNNLNRFYKKFTLLHFPYYTSSTTSTGECNIFEGQWVRVSNREPYYPLGSCPYIERSPYDCYKNGRPDDAYLKWQWQWQSHPSNNGCNKNIPSILNAGDFLERLRGKKVAFSGDSLNRNMFESLACILWNAVPDKSKVSWLPGNIGHDIRGDMAVRYEDYNCTVGFVWSPFLVYETNPKNRRTQEGIQKQVRETMRLDMIDPRASTFYRDADVVVFDSWHWWVGNKVHNGKDYFQEGNSLYPQLEINKAYKKALGTWRRWIDKNIDSNKTQVAFAEYSETHYEGGQWNTHGKCNRETEPIMSNETYRRRNPSRAKVLHDTLRLMKTPVLYLNISKLTYYRADGHPSIYSKNLTVQERIASTDPQDCVHWCLPGVPDTWNELLYIALMRAGKGSFAQ